MDESRVSRLIYRQAEWVIRHRMLVLVCTCILVSLVGYGSRHIEFDPDSRVFFGERSPQKLALDFIENTYSKSNGVIFVVAPESGGIFSGETLRLIDELTEAAWHLPYSTRVSSLTNFQHSYAVGDEVIVEGLYRPEVDLSVSELKRLRDIALRSPELAGQLVARDGRSAAVVALVSVPDKHSGEVREIAAKARELVTALQEKYPHAEIYLTGGIMADVTFEEAGRRDMAVLAPVMVVIIFVALWAGLRSWAGTLVTVLVVGFSTLVAVGTAGWFGQTLNSATSAAPVIIMTLCVADCVHILITLIQKRRAGVPFEEALKSAVRENVRPVTVTSVTTAIGFVTLNFSESPPFGQLGNLVALGVMTGFVLSITFLPAFLSFFPSQVGRRTPLIPVQSMTRLAEFVTRKPRALMIVSSSIFVLTVIGIGRITFDDNFIEYFDSSYDFRVATDYLENHLTGLNVVAFSLPSGETQGVTNPEYLRAIDTFANWLNVQPGVSHVSVFSNVMKRLNKSMHGDDPAFERIPDNRALAAQYLLFYELSQPVPVQAPALYAHADIY